MSGEKNQGVGPLIGSIIIVVLLLAGGYYSWMTSGIVSPVDKIINADTSDQPVPAISIPATPPQASTEITDIEADAMSVDITTIDSGLENLDLLVK